MGLSKLWGKDSTGAHGFVFSHIKTIYYNWAQKKLLSTKLDEMDTATSARLEKSKTLDDYASIISNQTAGFWPDALAVKEGFAQLNTDMEEVVSVELENLAPDAYNIYENHSRHKNGVLYLSFLFQCVAPTNSYTVFSKIPDTYNVPTTFYFGSMDTGPGSSDAIFCYAAQGNNLGCRYGVAGRTYAVMCAIPCQRE